ncbi:MFS transporter [Candidatus Bathyarchaeota archaeon]|nr:MFS transporter [Candidatus Bathyarchaeota archaeon]
MNRRVEGSVNLERQDRAKRALRILLVCVFIAMIGLGIVSPIMPIYASDLGATGVWIGLIYSSFSLSRALLMTPIGRVSDVRSKKKIMCLGLGAYALASILYVFAWNPLFLTAVRFIHGVGSAMVIPVASAYVVELTPKGEEGRYMGMMNMAMFTGFGVGPLIGGYLTNLSYAVTFYAMTALISVSLLLTLLFVPEESSLNIEKKNKRVPSLRVVMLHKRLKAIFIYRLIDAFGRGSIMAFLSLFANQTLGIPLPTVGLLLSIGILANSLLQTPMGIIADRHNRVMLVVAGGLIGSAGYLYLYLSSNLVNLITSRLIVALGAAMSLPALSAIAAEEGKKIGPGSTMGLFNTAMSTGQIMGPIISGVLLDLYDIYTIFEFTALVCIVGVILFYLITRS